AAGGGHQPGPDADRHRHRAGAARPARRGPAVRVGAVRRGAGMRSVWAGWAGALLAVATGALAPAWAGPLAAPVFAVVAVLPLAAVWAADRLRCPRWMVVAAV